MWPPDDTLRNALIAAVTGSALIIATLLGSVLGRSATGRKAVKAASIVLGILIVFYLAAAIHLQRSGPDKECIYAPAHPSDC